MWQYDLALETHWVTHGGYFRLANIVEFGMGIIYGKLLLCNDIKGKIRDKKITMR